MISPDPADAALHRVMVFNDGHTRGRIYSPSDALFRQGGLDSLALLPSDQLILARVLPAFGGALRPRRGGRHERTGPRLRRAVGSGKIDHRQADRRARPRSSATTASSSARTPAASASTAPGATARSAASRPGRRPCGPCSSSVRPGRTGSTASTTRRPSSAISCPGSSGRSSRPTGGSGPWPWPRTSSAKSRSTTSPSTRAGPSSTSWKSSWRRP